MNLYLRSEVSDNSYCNKHRRETMKRDVFDDCNIFSDSKVKKYVIF